MEKRVRRASSKQARDADPRPAKSSAIEPPRSSLLHMLRSKMGGDGTAVAGEEDDELRQVAFSLELKKKTKSETKKRSSRLALRSGPQGGASSRIIDRLSGEEALKVPAGSSGSGPRRQGQAELAAALEDDERERMEEKLTSLVPRQSPKSTEKKLLEASAPSSAAQSIYNRSTRGLFQQQSQLIDPNRVFGKEEEIYRESEEESSSDSVAGDSASSPDDSGDADADDYSNLAVHQVTEEMEMYYDLHFKSYEVLTLPAGPEKQQKVWHVFFDATYDIVYNFLAKSQVAPKEPHTSGVKLKLHL